MADRPLIFSGPMIQALLAGRKFQTRRLLDPQPLADSRPTHFVSVSIRKRDGRRVWEAHDQRGPMEGVFPGPPGLLETQAFTPAPGDRFWVREAWRTITSFDNSSPNVIAAVCRAAGYRRPWAPLRFEADGAKRHSSGFLDEAAGRRRASMHLPRWASRLTLLVSDVRVQRLQDITREDAMAEGIVQTWGDFRGSPPPWALRPSEDDSCFYDNRTSVENFRLLWNHLNGADAWDENPWVWAATFSVEHANIDALPATTPVPVREAAYA